jgi:hypothetical protein
MKPGDMGISPERLQRIRDWQDADPSRAALPHRDAAKALQLPESALRRARASIAQGLSMTSLALDAITIDPTLQLRADLDRLQTEQYAERYRESLPMPPVVVFREGEVYRLADGHQRHDAAKLAGLDSIDAEVREGDYLAALSYAAGANAAHGVNRTNADKARAVAAILARPEFAETSDREVARICHVSHPFVRAVRDRGNPAPPPAAPPEPPAPDRPKDPEVQMTHSDPEPPAPPAANEWTPRVEPDGEWLAGFRVRTMLSDRCRAIFDADAVFWRKLSDHPDREKFANVVHKHQPPESIRGRFAKMVNRMLRSKGPDHWLVCSACNGTGHGQTASQCQSCYGSGYSLAF